MKFTAGELLELADSIMKLGSIQNVTALTGFRLANLVRKLKDPTLLITNARNSLIQKYAGAPENGTFTVKPENMAQYYAELTMLLNEEIDLEVEPIELPSDAILPDASTLFGLDKLIILKSN